MNATHSISLSSYESNNLSFHNMGQWGNNVKHLIISADSAAYKSKQTQNRHKTQPRTAGLKLEHLKSYYLNQGLSCMQIAATRYCGHQHHSSMFMTIFMWQLYRAKSRVFLRPNNCHFPPQNKGKNSPIFFGGGGGFFIT